MRVFILGSGFCADAGMPVSKNLFGEMMKYVEETDRPLQSLLHRYLEQLYPHFRTPQKNYPNIEDLLSILQARNDWASIGLNLQELKSYQTVEELIRKLMIRFFLKQTFDKAVKNERFAYYINFAEKIGNGDVVLSFNYDYVLDIVFGLQKATRDIVIYDSYFSNKISLFKLHGSVGWLIHPLKVDKLMVTQAKPFWTGYIRNGEQACIYDLDVQTMLKLCENGISADQVWDHLQNQKRTMPVFIIPPAYPKSLETIPALDFLKKIWAAALDCLARTDEVIAIGYSLPPEDLPARALMREGIRRNPHCKDVGFVKIYDPDLPVKLTFEKSIVEQVEFHQTTFANSPWAKAP